MHQTVSITRTLFGCSSLALALSCCFGFSDDEPEPAPPPECTIDADCAFLDGDDDVCTVADCSGGNCQIRFAAEHPACECQDDGDCPSDGACSEPACVDYQCEIDIAPAGPAPQQTDGDCSQLSCDGSGTDPVVEPDPSDAPTQQSGDCAELSCDAATGEVVSEPALDDLPEAVSDCTVPMCEDTGPSYQAVDDGSACQEEGFNVDGFCFNTECMPCAAVDPSSNCGGEGNNEPQNDSASTATTYARYDRTCGLLDPGDVDWYTFYADDRSFENDILDFNFWSSADSIDVCVYVRCHNDGNPGGGCSNKIAGPDGSQGCCWSGDPTTIAPVWDLDCSGTTEDSGTVYLSIAAPTGGNCEKYALTGDY